MLKVANPAENVQEMIRLSQEACEKQCTLLVFPELSITGYTCGDLFEQRILQTKALEALLDLREASAGKHMLIVAGYPGPPESCTIVLLSYTAGRSLA
jgi:NAD+ synthase (glutamine-hydrolysing)